MALDYQTLQEMAASQPANATSYCPECGRPWADPTTGSPQPAAWFPWRAALLVAVGLALAITFGLRAVADYPRALRDHAILQATAACLAQMGGRADCAPSYVVTLDGWTDVSALVDQAAAMRRKLAGDLLAAIGGTATVLLGLRAAMRRQFRVRSGEPARSATVAAGVGEGFVAVGWPLVLALAVDLFGDAFGQSVPSAGDLLDRTLDGIAVLISSM
jgi:hypothetical protein